MATYVVGDIQGCFDALQRLLAEANFDPEQDCLWCCGDLINRGPDSLQVLRFIKNLPHKQVVLGNHDITLLAIVSGVVPAASQPTLDKLLNANDLTELITWLRQQPILHIDSQLGCAMVHAGIPPQWDLHTAKQYSRIIEAILQGPSDGLQHYLQQAFHTARSVTWHAEQPPELQLAYITDALTRLRFCTKHGALDLTSKMLESELGTDYRPWFSWQAQQLQGHLLYFGHWAALGGQCPHPQIQALDTGCVWGHELTMQRIEDKKVFQVAADNDNG